MKPIDSGLKRNSTLRPVMVVENDLHSFSRTQNTVTAHSAKVKKKMPG